MPTVKDASQHILLDAIRSVVPSNGQWKVLVLDPETTKIISSCCRMFDIMEDGVTLVENLNIARQPLPHLDGLYFVTPTEESIKNIIKDFNKPSQPQYNDVHLVFTSRLSDALMMKIKNCSLLLSRIRTCKELYLEYLANESQCFNFNMPSSLNDLYSPQSAQLANTETAIATKLMSLCISLGEYPNIRYHLGAQLAKNVSMAVQDQLDQYRSRVPTFPESTDNQATLLIIDRGFDLVAPVMHEYTYQAMLYDLLDIQGEKYQHVIETDGKKETKDVLLNENDILWPTYRHVFIADCIDQVTQNFAEFTKSNKAAGFQKNMGGNELKDASDAIRAMPQFREYVGKYSLHIALSSKLMEIFNQKRLEDVSKVEQNLAVGEDVNGQALKNAAADVSSLLQDTGIGAMEKLRLLIVYLLTQENIRQSDCEKLMEMAKVGHTDRETIKNLEYLGFQLGKGVKREKKDKKDKKAAANDDYELNRFKPGIAKVISEHIEEKLDTKEFPYVKDPVAGSSSRSQSVDGRSARTTKKKAGWADAKKNKDKKEAVEEPTYHGSFGCGLMLVQ
jgi:hypothetical protein